MEKNFENEKIRIRVQVRRLFRQPLKELVGKVPAISRQELDKIMAIFWQFSGRFTAISRQDFCTISSVFPAMLDVISPDFSRERLEFLVDFLVEEAKNRRINMGPGSKIYGD